MSLTSIGDLSQTLFLRRHNVEIKQHLETLSHELTTGLKADVAKAVGHDFSLLSGIERGISLSETYYRAASEARVVTEAAQNSLGMIQEEIEALGSNLLTVANSGIDSNITIMGQAGLNSFEALVSTLNTSVAGRYIFSGQNTDTTPVMSAEQILNTLRPLAQAAPTTQDAIDVIDAWFADAADFTTTAYFGTTAPAAGFLVGEQETLSMNITADRSEVRETLAAAAKVALLGDLTFPNGATDAELLMKTAAEELMAGGTKMTYLRGELGQTEESIALAEARSSTELSALQISRSDLLSADPYETATALEDATTRLESLYTLTARLSRLSLTDFLR